MFLYKLYILPLWATTLKQFDIIHLTTKMLYTHFLFISIMMLRGPTLFFPIFDKH